MTDDPERWEQISRLLDELLDEPPERRAGRLREFCGDDDRLRTRVERLLAAADRPGFLDSPAGLAMTTALRLLEDATSVREPAAAPGTQIGPYRVVQEIARGGMGVVYLGERDDGQFEQQVALKLMDRRLSGEEVVGRFRHERQILARLQHPQIARLLDGGTSPDGRPWFAMEYVQGEAITAWCDRQRTGIDERLKKFEQVCEAVQYAHRNLVVHCDLKPSNILVTSEGQVRLLDFGIARLLSRPGGDAVDQGQNALEFLTPEYAAPEQIRGEAPTAATDVYALGVVLNELLTGRRPAREGAGASGSGAGETPSRTPIPDEVAARRSSTPQKLRRRLQGDLDAIVRTAVAEAPDQRYPSAEALARDLERYRTGLPTRARGDALGYRFRKAVSRHRVGFAAAALVLLALVAGMLGTTWQALVAAREAARAREVKEFLVRVFQVSDPSRARGDEVTARELLDEGARRVERELGSQPELQAEMMSLLADLYQNLGLMERALALADGALETRRSIHGPRHPEVATSLRQRGLLLYELGNYDDAELVLREALEMHRSLLGPRHAEVAEDLDRLAIVLRGKGEFGESEALCRESLAIRTQTLDPDDALLATSLNNLAVVLREKGNYEDAEELYRQVVERWGRVLGDDHPDLLLALNNLAALLSQQGRTAEAEALHRRVLAMHLRVYGEDHPATARSRNNLASTLLQEARYDEAAQLYREVLRFWAATEGEDHPNAVVTRNNLGTVLAAQGHLQEAEEIFRGLAGFWGTRLGELHPYRAVALGHLSNVLREAGRYDEATAAGDEALAIRRSALGPEHPDVALSLYQAGWLALDRGRPDEAERLHREALAMRERLLGEQHPFTMLSRVGLAAALRAAGDPGAAVELAGPALQGLRTARPAGHPETALAALEYGDALGAMGRWTEAEGPLREAVDARRALFSPGSWRAAEAELRLARCLEALGRAAEAEGLREEGAAALRDGLGDHHPLVLELVGP